jgi:signal transduction histidine kinase
MPEEFFVKRTQRPSSSPVIPTVRALPPRKRRLVDMPGFRPALRILGGVVVALLILGGAFGAVVALDRGMLPPIAIPLASLSVIAATAAYLAGRAEGKKEFSSAAHRNRAKGRLQKSPKARAAADNSASATSAADGACVPMSQAGSVVLRTKFLDDISQALRAPITSICLAARIIRKHYDSTPEVVAHFGDTLLAEADRLGQTVDEFLELARLESGVIEWHEDEVDAADLIQRAVAEVEPVAVSYGVSVAFTMEPALPPLHVDRERITQALTILLAMSVRSASEGGEIVIQIAGAHGGWVFTVGGTSFVYPHAEARKVKARADATAPVEHLESRPDGVGLGLCLGREIVARYEGRLWIEGQPGASGCARFTIPYRQHRRAAAATVAPTPSARPEQTKQPRAADTAASRTPDTAEIMSAAVSAPNDLDQRREAAVQALRDRAASLPHDAESAKTTVVDGEKSEGENETTSAQLQQADNSSALATTVAENSDGAPAANTAAKVPSEDAASIEAGDSRPAPRARPGAKISFSRSQTVSQPNVSARPELAPRATCEPTKQDQPPLNFSDCEPTAVVDVPQPEVEIDDAPVHAPVSGTMITATHRTAGPPVLASPPGVPAFRGAQSAATAAIQGSDDLLLEIAEAQSPDGRSLVVSEEVRSLLASAPGTLPAVAGQNSPAAASRGAYTPSRRRMVQAPWVVRPGAEGKSGENDSAPQAKQPNADEAAAGGQRARLNERLAKRLGLSGTPQSGKPGSPSSGSGPSAYMRSRRLGSR